MSTSLPPTPARPHVSGYLYATCARDETDKCILTRKNFKTPIHISKPYWDGHSLLLNLMCPTAGMLAGDSVDLDIETESGSSLTLSNPSSLRIHKMDPESDSRWTQRFSVASQSFLENNPEWLILQGESSLTQRTSIAVAAGGELFFIEAIAPGRIAHAETFAFRRYRSRLSLRYDGKLALLEKHAIEPAQGSASAWQNDLGKPFPFYLSLLLVSEQLSDPCPLWREVHDLQNEGVRIGCSRLAHGPCWNVKILASDPIAARKAATKVRAGFYAEIGRPATNLRR